MTTAAATGTEEPLTRFVNWSPVAVTQAGLVPRQRAVAAVDEGRPFQSATTRVRARRGSPGRSHDEGRLQKSATNCSRSKNHRRLAPPQRPARTSQLNTLLGLARRNTRPPAAESGRYKIRAGDDIGIGRRVAWGLGIYRHLGSVRAAVFPSEMRATCSLMRAQWCSWTTWLGSVERAFRRGGWMARR